jgi:hypothetical protein
VMEPTLTAVARLTLKTLPSWPNNGWKTYSKIDPEKRSTQQNWINTLEHNCMSSAKMRQNSFELGDDFSSGYHCIVVRFPFKKRFLLQLCSACQTSMTNVSESKNDPQIMSLLVMACRQINNTKCWGLSKFVV